MGGPRRRVVKSQGFVVVAREKEDGTCAGGLVRAEITARQKLLLTGHFDGRLVVQDAHAPPGRPIRAPILASLGGPLRVFPLEKALPTTIASHHVGADAALARERRRGERIAARQNEQPRRSPRPMVPRYALGTASCDKVGEAQADRRKDAGDPTPACKSEKKRMCRPWVLREVGESKPGEGR